MAFQDVVEMETVSGDTAYTLWLAAGRPNLEDADTAVQVLTTSPLLRRRNRYRSVQTLPEL